MASIARGVHHAGSCCAGAQPPMSARARRSWRAWWCGTNALGFQQPLGREGVRRVDTFALPTAATVHSGEKQYEGPVAYRRARSRSSISPSPARAHSLTPHHCPRPRSRRKRGSGNGGCVRLIELRALAEDWVGMDQISRSCRLCVPLYCFHPPPLGLSPRSVGR